jgi:predicted nucleic acid-binding protein
LIIDTSVFYDFVVDGPRSLAAANLISRHDVIMAPDLIEAEIASALTRSVRRKHLSADDARSSFDLAQEVMPMIEPTQPLLKRAFELSLELQHPAPDCIFLALAERQNDQMATSDAKFARKLAGTNYNRFVHLIEP